MRSGRANELRGRCDGEAGRPAGRWTGSRWARAWRHSAAISRTIANKRRDRSGRGARLPGAPIGFIRQHASCGGKAMEFSGQTVIVTGAAGNLGRAVVDAFAAAGANLVLAGLRPNALAGQFGRETDRQ